MLQIILITAVLVGADQALKSVVSKILAPDGNLELIPQILELRYVENRGAAFSILSGQQFFLIFVTSVALFVIIYIILFKKPDSKLEYIGYLLILAGGMGNLVDRIRQGFVVDYINLLFIKFAVFNLADIFVTCGFAILLIKTIIGYTTSVREDKDSLAGSSNG